MLLQRFAQFIEQSCVLDGDDGLICEGLKQGDLSFGENLRLSASEGDGANRGSFSHQRDAKDRAEAPTPSIPAALGEFAHLGLHVSKMHGPLIENRSARSCPADQR